MDWENKQGPWGKSHRPPEIDQMLEKLQSQFRGLFANKQFPALWIFLAAILVLWLATGIYQVNSEEKGVVQRFGAYDRTMDPGLHWKWPSGIPSRWSPTLLPCL